MCKVFVVILYVPFLNLSLHFSFLQAWPSSTSSPPSWWQSPALKVLGSGALASVIAPQMWVPVS